MHRCSSIHSETTPYVESYEQLKYFLHQIFIRMYEEKALVVTLEVTCISCLMQHKYVIKPIMSYVFLMFERSGDLVDKVTGHGGLALTCK